MSSPKYQAAGADEEAAQQDSAPKYKERAVTNNQAPPTYNSMFGKIRQAKRDSQGSHMNFLQKTAGIILQSWVTIFVLALLCAFPVSMIVIGALKLNDCPAEHFIPKWLLIFGCFGLVAYLFTLLRQVVSDEKHTLVLSSIVGILLTFLLAWFIAGNVWVYRTYKFVKYDPDAGDDYCDKLLYLFSFWIITSGYIIMYCVCDCAVCIGFICFLRMLPRLMMG